MKHFAPSTATNSLTLQKQNEKKSSFHSLLKKPQKTNSVKIKLIPFCSYKETFVTYKRHGKKVSFFFFHFN